MLQSHSQDSTVLAVIPISDAVYLLQSQFDFTPQRFTMRTPRREIFEFKVQACDFAFIGLISELTGFSYEVVLGYQNNEKVILFETLTRNTLAVTNYEGVLRSVRADAKHAIT